MAVEQLARLQGQPAESNEDFDVAHANAQRQLGNGKR